MVENSPPDITTTTTGGEGLQPKEKIGHRQNQSMDNNSIEVEKGEVTNTTVAEDEAAVVPTTDDPSLPVNTIRAWSIGLLFCIVGSGFNTFFEARQPGIYVSPFVGQFLAYPLGVSWAKTIPNWSIFGIPLNPGPFNKKEHYLITVMSNVAFPGAVLTEFFMVQQAKPFYNDKSMSSGGFMVLLVLSTQLIGYGLAGLGREFLVYPADVTWPTNLASIAMVQALHRNTNKVANGWKISQWRFFMIMFGLSFIYLWFSGYLAKFLTYFNWMTWISPTNVKLAAVTGSVTGIGLNILPTFDWTFCNSAGLAPLITPFWATLHLIIGATVMAVIVIICWFKDMWYSSYLPINSAQPFDNQGLIYNVTRILGSDNRLDEAAYKAYSPAYFSSGYTLLYGAYFSAYTAAIVHCIFFYRESVVNGFKNWWKRSRSELNYEEMDIHNQLMARYKEAPAWWYAVVLVIAFVLGVACNEKWGTGMPVWGIVLCLIMSAIFYLPLGMIRGTSNLLLEMVVIAQVIPGFALEGQPYANMIWKVYGWMSLNQAINFTQDLKLGHYAKIPPRSLFSAQIVACILSALVSVGVVAFQLSEIEGICEPGQPSLLTCPVQQTFFSASVLWGLIGPRRLYGDGALYHKMLYFFVAGALAPLVPYAISKKWPKSYFAKIHVPAFINGMLFYAPWNWAYVWSNFVLGAIFQQFIRNRWRDWWIKYNYVLSIALTTGASICAIIMFFATGYHVVNVSWWGNNVPYAGCDGTGCPLNALKPGEHFGP